MPNTETKWVKFGNITEIAFLGKEIIAIASGIHVLFINLDTKDEKVERFDSKERGEGACCLAGHPVVSMFAISERRSNPRISIFTYPEIHRVSICVYKTEKRWNGFLSSTFAGTDYLLTLTSFPNFRLIVWLWRTGEHLTAIETGIIDAFQSISVSASSPHLAAQWGQSSGKIAVYEVSVCSKIISLLPVVNSLSTERITSSSWTHDGNLLLCDDVGNISLIYSDGKRRFFIVKTESPGISNGKPLVVAFRGGVIIAKSNLRISFYKKPSAERVKSGGSWKFIWELEIPSHPVYMVRHPRRDSILIFTIRGNNFEVIVGENDIPNLHMICQHGSGYLFLVPINPVSRHFGVIDRFDDLLIFEGHSGQLLSNLSLDSYGKVLCAISHPFLPVIAITTETGKMNVISIEDAADPIIIQSIFLIRQPLAIIKFSWNGKALGTADASDGKLFVMKGFENMELELCPLLETTQKIIDFLIYEDKLGGLKILLLVRTHPNISVGRNIIIYRIKESGEILPGEFILQLPNIFKILHYGLNQGDIIVNPYLTKQLYLIKFEDSFRKISVTEALTLSHRLRGFNINTGSRYILTFGYDGLVIVQNKTNFHQSMIYSSHHRQEGGTKSGVECASNLIITLGRNGNLVATKISQLELFSNSSDIIDRGENFVNIPQVVSSSTRSGPYAKSDSTWLEWKDNAKLMREQDEMAVERSAIISTFEKFRLRLKIILDRNEEEPSSYARLPVSTFDLNIGERIHKIDEDTSKQEEMKKNLEGRVKRQDEVSMFLLKLCSDSMRIPACALISLDGKIRVDNHALPIITQDEKNRRAWGIFSIKLARRMMNVENSFAANPGNSDCENRTEHFGDAEDDYDDEENKFAMTGTTTHRWIREDSSQVINQIHRQGTYTEGVRSSILTEIREEKLKNYFNNLFEDMRRTKDLEIKLAESRIAEIRHCSSELRQMFGIQCSVDHSWLKLMWHDSERPQTIIEVEDTEVLEVMKDSVGTSYVAHSDDSVSEEQETLLSVDNFRENFMDRIMDGVLEVRWEDEIKKEIAQPISLTKDPTNYTEGDKISMKAYEIALTNLEAERSKYRKILEDQMSKVQESLKQNVDDFNEKMEIFFLKRIELESSVLQETLMRLRESLRHQSRLQGIEEISRLENEELIPAIREVKKSIDDAGLLESMVNDTKIRYENLNKREKILEGKFRGEFPDLKQPMVEHLSRHYKKRPRIGQVTCTSMTFLSEISRCILSGEKSDILPRECLDFLKDMNVLDIMPTSLPHQIDNNHWHLLCKLRRSKVEIETRLKSCVVELAEAEQASGSHQRAIQTLQNRIQQLRETIEDRKRLNSEGMRDMEIQLVIKMGQIETSLTGHPSEFQNSVLVPFDELLKVNDAIVDAGRKKLIAMNQTIEFRRSIEWKEWRHNCMRMTLEDMEEELKVLQGVKVTKEIQTYLMRHRCIVGTEKDSESWESSQLSTKERYHRILENEKTRLLDAIRRINLWQKRNDQIGVAIEKMKLQSFKNSMLVNDDSYTKSERFSQIKFKWIMKRNRLVKKIQDNYRDLLALQAQIELLRLKTYPTLRLNNLKQMNRKL